MREKCHEGYVDLDQLSDLRWSLLGENDKVLGWVVTNSYIVDQNFEVKVGDG